MDGIDYGYAPADEASPTPHRARCCHACEGRGEIATSVYENRRHYLNVVGTAQRLADDARQRAACPQRKRDDKGAFVSL